MTGCELVTLYFVTIVICPHFVTLTSYKRILSVCPFVKYTFLLLDGIFTPKLMLPARKGGHQQVA
jgi:hypothetical protein